MPLQTEVDTTQPVTQPIIPPTTAAPTNPYVDLYFEPIQTEPKAGDVIFFTYTKRLYYEIHDRTPLVLVLNSAKQQGWQKGRCIRGVNLHYLTYSLMGQIIEMAHKGSAQNYEQIKTYQMCANSFRHYLWNWIAPGSIRKMSIIAVQAEVNTIKQYGKMNQEDLREVVRQQLEQKTKQPRATEITKPIAPIPTTPAIGTVSPENNTLHNNMEPAVPMNQ